MNKIKIGILGFGNVGRAAAKVIELNLDMELVAIFTRRDFSNDLNNTKIINVSKIAEYKDKIDVLLLCSGSATDLPTDGPKFAKIFNVVDSFDTHVTIPEYYETMNTTSSFSQKVSVISTGWDPGIFSINRLFGEVFLPVGKTYTFWGPGVSQGHSQAIRSITGVQYGIQYTVPVEDSIEKVRNGENPELSIKEKHTRLCYVVAKSNADKDLIEKTIINMPNYFADYITTVNFISEEEFNTNHKKLNHGGFVIRSGNTTTENNQIIEYSLKLNSNAEFTASVMLAYARAAKKIFDNKEFGAKTVFDIAPSMLSPKSTTEIIRDLL